MSYEMNDPGLTAYVLGELEDTERADLETAVENDPNLRNAIEEIREMTELMRAGLAAEPTSQLSEEQHRHIEQTAKPRRMNPAIWTSIAALLLMAMGFAMKNQVFESVKLTAEEPSSSRGDSRSKPKARAILVPPPERPVSHVLTVTESEAVFAGDATEPYLENVSDDNSHIKSSASPVTEADPSDRIAEGKEKFVRAVGLARFYNKKKPMPDLDPSAVVEDQSHVLADQPSNTEDYDLVVEAGFTAVTDDPLATFSIDVDTASYANTRRYINQGSLPPIDAVRIEELINYFDYADPEPVDGRPFAVNVELADAPWASDHRLMRVGIKAHSFDDENRPACNLVFLVDVSGSMKSPNKLPLLVKSLGLLAENLGAKDRVTILVYAGASGIVLPATRGDNVHAINGALRELLASGSTNGAAGIRLAYAEAKRSFIKGGVNRVVLATDGDFNVGIADRGSLLRLIEEEAKSDVYLTVLGFGMGNLKDGTLEQLAARGNGNYAYIDSLEEAQKVLVEEAGGTLVSVAKDVKIQVEFNPQEVASYRLIGYENRKLAHKDFNDDSKDAGDVGAGHSLTVLYELVPPRVDVASKTGVDRLKYQHAVEPNDRSGDGELLTIKLRYKEVDEAVSKLIEIPVRDIGNSLADASDDLRFAAAVAAFGMRLRKSEYIADYPLEGILELAQESTGFDPNGYRSGFLDLVEKARKLMQKP